jgi:hypothetical protein
MSRRKRAGAPCAKCAELETENRTLRMQLAAQDDVIAMQNGAMDEIGRLIEDLPGGLLAKITVVLHRHGVKVLRPQRPLQ